MCCSNNMPFAPCHLILCYVEKQQIAAGFLDSYLFPYFTLLFLVAKKKGTINNYPRMQWQGLRQCEKHETYLRSLPF